MSFRRISNQTFIFALAFLLGFAIRLILLGSKPLDDVEASWALQAFNLARGNSIEIGENPGYVLLTALLFDVFPTTDWLARLIPVLAGSALILVPIFLRKLIGEKPAILLAFALALDPGLLALSRQAGGTMLTVSMGCLALSAWIGDRKRLSGVFFGLALLGGQAFWPGLIGAALAALLVWALLRERKPEPLTDVEISETPDGADKVMVFDAEPVETETGYLRQSNGNHTSGGWKTMRTVLASTLVVLLIAGTLFFRYPQGLSGIGTGLAAYLQSWGQTGSYPSSWWILMLVFYHPIPLIMGLIGIVRDWVTRLRLECWLSIWIIVELLIAAVNPARQPSDLLWVIVPLWVIAVREIARDLRLEREDLFPAVGQAIITGILLTFLFMNLYSLVLNIEGNTEFIEVYKIVLAGGSVLILASIFLISWGWYYTAALRGFAWGALVVLAAYTLSMSSLAGGYRETATAELWRPAPTIRQVGLLVDTLEQFSQWGFTRRDAIDVVTAGVDSPALEWALRDFSDSRFVNFLEEGISPSTMITTAEEVPSLVAEYSGQDFVLRETTEWSSYTPFQWVEWLLYRKTPTSSHSLILWVRTDLFTAAKQSAPISSP